MAGGLLAPYAQWERERERPPHPLQAERVRGAADWSPMPWRRHRAEVQSSLHMPQCPIPALISCQQAFKKKVKNVPVLAPDGSFPEACALTFKRGLWCLRTRVPLIWPPPVMFPSIYQETLSFGRDQEPSFVAGRLCVRSRLSAHNSREFLRDQIHGGVSTTRVGMQPRFHSSGLPLRCFPMLGQRLESTSNLELGTVFRFGTRGLLLESFGGIWGP